ncbi:MAG: co-chaperone GroES [Candidatus Enteromonas sp.]|nr:co-chaperone GroES [bacterium]MDD6917413.1 co-chaperone GroES [bacterium]MDY6101404.1 co-chaperone GroES [Candidatus Enteromonas sp.]
MIKPLSDYVVLEKVPSEKKVGSIVLTSEKKQGNVATVIAVGPGKRNEKGELLPISVKTGEKVIYREYSGTDYEEEGHKYLLLKNEDILAVLE